MNSRMRTVTADSDCEDSDCEDSDCEDSDCEEADIFNDWLEELFNDSSDYDSDSQ